MDGGDSVGVDPGAGGRRSHDKGRRAFSDVLISPYSDLVTSKSEYGYYHRGGPHWPDWDAQTIARHHVEGEIFDVEPLPSEPEERISDEIAWGGAIVRNYGHQIVDFAMRLAPSVAEEPGRRIAFATHPRMGLTSIDGTSSSFRQILAWVGLPAERALLVASPMLAERLVVFPQAEQHLGPGPSPEHLDLMDELTARRMGQRRDRSGAVYVSRAGQDVRYAGESYLERVLAEQGITVMRPESLPIADQIATYVSAATLVFSEGSALFTLLLVGRGLGDIMVLSRGPWNGEGGVACFNLEPRAASLDYVSAFGGFIHGLRPSGETVTSLGSPIYDVAALHERLRPVLPNIADVWDRAPYEAARDADVLEWFEWAVRHPLLDSDASWDHMLSGLAECGLEHLRPSVKRLMDAQRGKRSSPQPPAGAEKQDPVSGGGPDDRRPWTATRLNAASHMARAETYLELGVDDGATFHAVRIRSKVGTVPPASGRPAAIAESDGELSEATPSDFLDGLPAQRTFDVVFLHDAGPFRSAYRSLLALLPHLHERSLLLIDRTRPMDIYETLDDVVRKAALAEMGHTVRTRVIGENFKLVVAVHDLHPELDYATIAGPNGQTLVWPTAKPQTRTPRYGSLDRIGGMSYFNLISGLEVLRLMEADAAFGRWEASRRADQDGLLR